MSRVHDLATLRNYVDDVAAALPLLALPRVEALLHTFRIAQSGHAMHAASVRSAAESYENIRSHQDLLRWLTFRIVKGCSPGGRIQNTTDRHRALAQEAIQVFDTIGKLNEFMLMAREGRCRVGFDAGQSLVAFTYDDDAASRRLFRRLIRQRDERASSMSSQANLPDRARELFDEVTPHVRPQWGDR